MWKKPSCRPPQAPTVSRRGGPGALLRTPTCAREPRCAVLGRISLVSEPTPPPALWSQERRRYLTSIPRARSAFPALRVPLPVSPEGSEGRASACGTPRPALCWRVRRPAPFVPMVLARAAPAQHRPEPPQLCLPTRTWLPFSFLRASPPPAPPAPSTPPSPCAGFGRLGPAARPHPAVGAYPSVPCSACFLHPRREASRCAELAQPEASLQKAKLNIGCWG